MTNERAIEILNPEHREHYDSIETVNEACRMGMEAFEYRTPKRPMFDEYTSSYFCPTCQRLQTYSIEDFSDYCELCGQALKLK